MALNNNSKTGSSTAIRWVCAACLVILCWLWVYCFQADSLAVKQHLLSYGQTRYEPHVGALLITLIAVLVQQVVYTCSERVMRLFGVSDDTGVFFSRQLWIHLLEVVVLMSVVIFASGTNAVGHYADRTEMSMLRGNYREALRHGNRSLEASPRLTMLRAHALAQQGQLGERFFSYAVAGTASDLLPTAYSPADSSRRHITLMQGSTTSPIIYPVDSIWEHLGAAPQHPMTTDRFLYLLCQRDSVGRGPGRRALPRMAIDYRLTQLLMERRLNDFARLLKRSYKIDERLPRHYREALILLRHTTTTPFLTYRDSNTEADFADYQAMKKQYARPSERHIKRLEQFFGTYWYYYDYAPYLQP